METLEQSLDEVIDGGEFDVRQHWPTLVDGQGSIDRLAATLKLRKNDVKIALMGTSYSQDAISLVFEEHGGIEGFRARCAKSTKRSEKVRGKKLVRHLTSESFEWTVCPVLQTVMKMPHILPCGHTFDKKTVVNICRRTRPRSGACPSCRKRFKERDAIRNYALEDAIKWYNSLPAMCKSSIDL